MAADVNNYVQYDLTPGAHSQIYHHLFLSRDVDPIDADPDL